MTHNREKGNVHILPNFSKFQFLSAFVAHIFLDRRGIKALSAPIKNEKIARVFWPSRGYIPKFIRLFRFVFPMNVEYLPCVFDTEGLVLFLKS